MSRRSLARKIARDLVGATGAKRVLGMLLIDAELLAYNVGGSVRRLPWRGTGFHVRAAARAIWRPAIANAAMLGVLAAVGCAWVYAAWAIAYVTTFSLWVRWRSLAEHAVMERSADPLRNTRTTRAGVLARLTVAPYHVNYHLEHHLLPTVPWFRLPALARLLSSRNAIPDASRARSYVDVFRQVTRGTPR